MMMIATDNRCPMTKGLVLHSALGYDLLVWLLTHGRPRAFRTTLARLAQGDVVLDVGSGTGSLALAASRQVGERGQVVGIDASPEMIARATKKSVSAGLDVAFKYV